MTPLEQRGSTPRRGIWDNCPISDRMGLALYVRTDRLGTPTGTPPRERDDASPVRIRGSECARTGRSAARVRHPPYPNGMGRSLRYAGGRAEGNGSVRGVRLPERAWRMT